MIRNLIEKYAPLSIELNDYMADNPEIGGQEFKASQKIVKLLNDKGFRVEFPFAGMETAFKATINEGKDIKAAILVEYDALRGMGHGCGHCASGAISILAALVINELKDKIDAQIDIIGTPDEEMNGAKATMVKQGVFDKYDFAIMIHMFNKNAVFTNFLALDAYDFEFTGKPAHAAASPWEGRNALNALRLMFDAIDMMRQHVKDDVRIHGFIKEGGVASNIVPEFASAEFCVRGKERAYLDDISSWVRDCARAAALATRTTVEIKELGEKFHEISRKPSGEKVLEDLFTDLELELTDLSNESGGSSDIGNVDYVCPAFHPMLSIGEDYGVHTKEFADAMKSEKTHEAIIKGGEIIVHFIMRVCENPQLLNEIKKEHSKAREK